MPQRGEAEGERGTRKKGGSKKKGGEKDGGKTGRGFSSAIPAISNYLSRGSRALRTHDTDHIVSDHPTRNVPTQPTPFTPSRGLQDLSAPTSTQKATAGFSTDCPLPGHPTNAPSATTNSTTMNHLRPLTSHPVNQNPPFPSSQSYGLMVTSKMDRPLFKSSHTYSNIPLPVKQYRRPSPKTSAATTHTNERTLYDRNAENIPPIASTTSTSTCPTPRLVPKPLSPKKQAQARPGIPKSRTLNVFSNLTASLSRTSLGQLTSNHSRHTSVSSKGTDHKDPPLYMSSQSASSTSSQALSNPPVETKNPRQIHTAQSSAYWTGRFLSLQDRFQSETLMPENLDMLVHAHAERSLIPVAQPSLGSSATMSCITPAAKPTRKPTRVATTSTSPQKLQNHQKPSAPPTRQQRAGTETGPKLPPSTTTVAPAQPSYEAVAALLVDEDNRARRIFLHLGTLCTTSEAHASLWQWQQAYARSVQKESLLPEGGTMKDKARELSWVNRLLPGSGNSLFKKGNPGP